MREARAYLTLPYRWPHCQDGSAKLLKATALEEANHCRPLPYSSYAPA